MEQAEAQRPSGYSPSLRVAHARPPARSLARFSRARPAPPLVCGDPGCPDFPGLYSYPPHWFDGIGDMGFQSCTPPHSRFQGVFLSKMDPPQKGLAAGPARALARGLC